MHIYVCTSTCVFFFNDAATTEIYTLSLHDALPIYRLVERHVTGGGEAADTRERLRFSVQQLERHALEVVGQIARRGTLVRMSGELELPPLHHVAGIGEARQHRASAVPVRVAARVIEVEMGVDDRSEERRVGKECRYRWWACQLEKKKEEEKKSLVVE